jgi:hypothetical protein
MSGSVKVSVEASFKQFHPHSIPSHLGSSKPSHLTKPHNKPQHLKKPHNKPYRSCFFERAASPAAAPPLKAAPPFAPKPRPPLPPAFPPKSSPRHTAPVFRRPRRQES